MRTFKLLVIVPLFGLLAATVNVSSADDDDPMQKAIKARQAVMVVRAWNAGPLFGMAKGEIEYDAERAATLANNLKAELAMNNGSMWPEGSDSAEYPDDTRSLPEIWMTYPAIAEAGTAYKEAVNALAAEAGNGLDALRSTIGDLGASCKGCHDDFRTN